MNRVFAATVVCGVVSCVGCGRGRVDAPGADAEAAGRLRATLVSATSAGGTEQTAAATDTGWGTLKGRLTFGDLIGKNGKTVTTVGGDKLTVVAKGTAVSVGGAPITKNDIAASNGVIQVVSKAVQPG